MCVCVRARARALTRATEIQHNKSHPSELLDDIQKPGGLGAVVADDTSSDQRHQQHQHDDRDHNGHHLQSAKRGT